MRFDSFLGSPRWEILQILSKEPSSPIELAKELKTTVAYMSQQLKLLDAAGLVVRTKTGASLKGKPRTSFQISDELIYIASLTKDLSEKKLIKAYSHHKAILNIWNLEDASLHASFVRLYAELETHLSDLEAIFLDTSIISPKIIVVTESKKLKDKIDSFLKQFSRKIDCIFTPKSNLKKFTTEKVASLHDPLGILNELKGGLKETVNGKD
ncbi:MAG TPA: winged helix-turn-helix domain-containing protein [Candidatus Nanoarchaeia archaeon]|nr:winged helix-turn-helix domain-containing protein [Candidatus Nanoarchaeia archaeon]